MIELRIKVVENAVVARAVEDKVKHQESKLATTQLKMVLKIVKALVMTFEADFREYRTSVERLFPDVDTSLLEVLSEQMVFYCS